MFGDARAASSQSAPLPSVLPLSITRISESVAHERMNPSMRASDGMTSAASLYTGTITENELAMHPVPPVAQDVRQRCLERHFRAPANSGAQSTWIQRYPRRRAGAHQRRVQLESNRSPRHPREAVDDVGDRDGVARSDVVGACAGRIQRATPCDRPRNVPNVDKIS